MAEVINMAIGGDPELQLDSVHRLELSVQNPTQVQWVYDIEWLLGETVGASWTDVALTAGQSADLVYDIIFGTYLPGDANMDGQVNAGDITYLEQVILGIRTPNAACDANLDGKIDIGDVTAIEQIILGMRTSSPVTLATIGTYSSKVKVTEKSTGTVWVFEFEGITISGPVVGTLQAIFTPPGANIYINNNLVGVAPLTVDLIPGAYDIKATLTGYLDWTGTVQIVAGQTTTINVVLTAQTGVAVDLTWDGGTSPPPPPTGTQVAIHTGYQIVIYSGPPMSARTLFASILNYVQGVYLYVGDWVSGGSGYWMGPVQTTDTIIPTGSAVGIDAIQDFIWTY